MIIKKHLRTLLLILSGLLLSGPLLAATDNLKPKRATSNVMMQEGSAKSAVKLTRRQNISLTNFIPLALLVVVGAFLFRKEDQPVEEKINSVKSAVKKETPKKMAAKPVTKPKESSADNKKAELKDLSVGQVQCQAATAKQTRCKRKSSLESIEVMIKGKSYLYLSCSQHSKKFKPYKG